MTFNFNNIFPQSKAVLAKHFNICGEYDLLFYSNQMANLYRDLKENKKEEYLPTDRIVFTLFDIDYHLDENSPGFTLYNLQLILKDLDIPNYFCLILTNRPDYNNYTKIVQRQLTTDDSHIRSITTLLDFSWVVNVDERNFNTNSISNTFCVLSRQARPHRTYFMSQLFDKNLQDCGLVGYNNIPYITTPVDIDSKLVDQVEHLSLLPLPKNGNAILIYNTDHQRTLQKFAAEHKSYKNFNESIDLNDKNNSANFHRSSPLTSALIYVGLETVVQPSKIFVSRISFRGIVDQRPFILLAQPGVLQFLKSLGFKTFDKFWDESYDSIDDFEDRVDAIINILQIWSTYSTEELRCKAQEMQSILEYNYNYYRNEFESVLAGNLDKDCIRNLTNQDL